MARFVAFQVQDSEQYYINTEASCKLTVVNIEERLVRKSFINLNSVKIEEQTTFIEKFTEEKFT